LGIPCVRISDALVQKISRRGRTDDEESPRSLWRGRGAQPVGAEQPEDTVLDLDVGDGYLGEDPAQCTVAFRQRSLVEMPALACGLDTKTLGMRRRTGP